MDDARIECGCLCACSGYPEMECFGNLQKAAKMSHLHISPSLLSPEASTASGPTCFQRAALRQIHLHEGHRCPNVNAHSLCIGWGDMTSCLHIAFCGKHHE